MTSDGLEEVTMQHRKRWALVAVLLVLPLPLAACGRRLRGGDQEAVVVERWSAATGSTASP